MTGTDVFYGLGLLIVFVASPKDVSRFLTSPQYLKLCYIVQMYTKKAYLICHKLEWGNWRFRQSRIHLKSSKGNRC